MTDNTAPERIWATRIGVQPNNGHAGIFRSDAKEGQEYIRADLLERAIQTALEMAKEADAEYWGQPTVVSKRIGAIRVEDVMKKMEGEP